MHTRILSGLICLMVGAMVVPAVSMAQSYYPRDMEVQNVGTLMELDRAFARMSAEQGTYAAFDAFLDGGAVNMVEGAGFIHGRQMYLDRLSLMGAHTLTWEPLGGSLPEGSPIGYTYGRWTREAMDARGNPVVNHGKYVSIWRKQSDGSWKVIFEGGNGNADPRLNPLQ